MSVQPDAEQALICKPAENLPWYKEINTQQKHVAVATCLAWAIDSFDNLLFGFVMYTILTEFQTTMTVTGLIATCTMFASALGGILFGYCSDKFGRKASLLVSIMLYTIFTALIGFSNNIWFFFVTRVLVGIGLGGEWSAGATLIAEIWPEKHRGKGLGIMQSGMSIGGLIGAIVAGPIIAAWGWRYLFWIAAVPGVLIMIYIAMYIKESPLWLESKHKEIAQQKNQESVSFMRSGYLGALILGIVFVTFIMLSQWPVATFQTSYFNTPIDKGGVGIGTAISTQIQTPYFIGCLLGYLTFCFVSDRIGRKKAFLIFLGFGGIFMPLQYIIVKLSLMAYMVCTILAGYFSVGLYSGLGAFLAEAFPTKFRGTAIGLCYNGGRGIGSAGIFVAGAIIPTMGFLPILVGFALFSWLAFITAFFLKDRTGIKFEA